MGSGWRTTGLVSLKGTPCLWPLPMYCFFAAGGEQLSSSTPFCPEVLPHHRLGQEDGLLGWGGLLTLLVAVAKYPGGKSSFWKEGVVLAHSSSLQPVAEGKSRWKSPFSVVRKQEKLAGFQWGTPAHGTGTAHRVGLLTPIDSI